MIKLKAPAIVLLLLLFVACRKQEARQFSDWYFNTEAISSNNTRINEDKGGSSMYTMDGMNTNSVNRDNGFVLSCGLYSLPSSSNYDLYNGPPSYNPALLKLYIYHKGSEYHLSENDSAHVTISVVNGKRRYEIPEAWFINSGNNLDSALVKGTFCEP